MYPATHFRHFIILFLQNPFEFCKVMLFLSLYKSIFFCHIYQFLKCFSVDCLIMYSNNSLYDSMLPFFLFRNSDPSIFYFFPLFWWMKKPLDLLYCGSFIICSSKRGTHDFPFWSLKIILFYFEIVDCHSCQRVSLLSVDTFALAGVTSTFLHFLQTSSSEQ